MTEQEAIKWQEAFKKTYNGFPKEAGEACDMAISALEEIQQYREFDDKLQMEIGITVKELYEQWNVMLGEYLEYQQLGTVEELREAREKQRKKKPLRAFEEGINQYWYSCPVCAKGLGWSKNIHFDCCAGCGQAIDYSEVEE